MEEKEKRKMYQEDQEEKHDPVCGITGCHERAVHFSAVITKMDENQKKKSDNRQALGCPMVLCDHHTEGRKEYFSERGREIKIIPNFYKY